MSSPLVHAFFVGRAIAEIAYEQLEVGVTNALSELGKFDAEQRENLRTFVDQVTERAAREQEIAMQSRTTTIVRVDSTSTDLQATIDELRAEIAELRSELQRYRSRSL
jgi:predicted RNase H-like nuclease (RuvC/YqgF family)